MRLSAVRLFVDDIDAARAFYASRLGFGLKVDGSRFGYCVFDAGGADLVIERVEADAPADERMLVGRFSGVSFAVTDVAACHRDLQARGVRFSGAPERQAWGGILATFVDPSGNELQLVELPAAP